MSDCGRAAVSRPGAGSRRGTAAIIVVVLLVITNVVVVGMVLGGARHHDLTDDRVRTVQAFYAAEAGMNMAVRELMTDTDEDADGTIGSISDDDDDGSDPSVGLGNVAVTLVDGGVQLTVTSTGRAGNARRQLELIAE